MREKSFAEDMIALIVTIFSYLAYVLLCICAMLIMVGGAILISPLLIPIKMFNGVRD